MLSLLIIAIIFISAKCQPLFIYNKANAKQTPSKSSSKPSRKIKYGPNGKGYIEGFVSHGINNFNGESIIDLTSSGFGSIFTTPVYETFVQNTSGSIEINPTSNTDRNLPLVMGRDLVEFFAPFGQINLNESLYNKPYYDIGTTTSLSTNIDTRFVPIPFTNLPSNPSSQAGIPFYQNQVNPNPTLGDWETASGIVNIDCDNGTAIVSISICNALPQAIYTVYEVGVTNPGLATEGVYALPLGGVGQVIRTDENGNGELTVNLNWCPVRECIVGESIDCQVYFNVNHNSDYIVYGGDIAGYFWSPKSYLNGIVGSNHLWFPIYGELLQEPLNRYNEKQCKRGRRGLLSMDREQFMIESNQQNSGNNVGNIAIIINVGGIICQILLLGLYCFLCVERKRKLKVEQCRKYIL